MGGVEPYHCDGIICLTNDDTFISCNPAIKGVRFPDDRFEGVGFGYDRRVDDYKVVVCVCIYEWPFGLASKVYKLRTNSWK